MIIRRGVDPILTATLAIVVLANVALTVQGTHSLTGEVAAMDSIRRSTPAGPAAAVDGFEANWKRLEPLSSHSGWAVRYAAKTCAFCAEDTQWERLSAQLIKSGFKVTVLLPSADEAYPAQSLVPAGAPQIAFVSMDWMKQFRITITPSLLLFDRSGRLIWQQQGVLSPTNVEQALEVIGRPAPTKGP